jgi:hypothetical protein
MIKKYGTASPRQSKEYYQALTEKRATTCMERYGVSNPMHVQEFKDRMVQQWGQGSKQKKVRQAIKAPQKKDRVLPNGLELNVFLTKYRLYPPYFNKLFSQKKPQEFLTLCQSYLQSDPVDTLLNALPMEVSAIINKTVDNIVIPVILFSQKKQLFVTFDEYYWISERIYSQEDTIGRHKTFLEKGAWHLNITRADVLLSLDAVIGSILNFFELNQSINEPILIEKLSKKDAHNFFKKSSLYQYYTYTDTYAIMENHKPILAISVKALETELLITMAANRPGYTVPYGYQRLMEEVLRYHPNLNKIKYIHPLRSTNTEILQGLKPEGKVKYSYEWTDGLQLYPKSRFSENNNTYGMLRVFDVGSQIYSTYRP